MSNQSPNAEKKSAYKKSPAADAASSSSHMSTSVFSSSDDIKIKEDQSNTEQISLSEKTRFGFVSDAEANAKLLHSKKMHEPVRVTLTQEQIGNSPGLLLRYNRECQGYSTQDIAKKLKVRLTTVYDLENDRLAQETAVKFTSQLLASYATILHLDPDTVVNLYLQKVTSLVKINQESVPPKPENKSHALRYMLLIVLMLAVAGGGVYFFGDQGASKTKGEITLSEPDSGNLDLSSQESEQSNELVKEEHNLNDFLNQGAQEASSVQDANTALSTKATEDVVESNEPKFASLPLSDKTIEQKRSAEKAKAQDSQVGVSNKANESKSAELAKVEQDSKNVKAQDSKQESSLAEANKATEAKQDADSKQEAESKQDAKADATILVLNNKLTNISDKVKIVDRKNSIPSLNNLEIDIIKDVALEIKGSGKSIRSGVFKAGDNLKLTSIPPFEISVADTTAIRIKYLDGIVQIPNSKQVTFKLPER